MRRLYWLSHRDIGHPRSGGAERTAFELSRRLCTRGYPVRVVTAGWRGSMTYQITDGVEYSRKAPGPLVHLSAFAELLLAAPESIVVADLSHVIPWLSPVLLRRPGVAFFRHLHSRTLPGQVTLPASRLLASVERSYSAIYEGWPIVTESLTSVSDLGAMGFARASIHRIPPGVSLEQFTPGTRAARPRIVYFGGFRRYKRAERAICVLEVLVRMGIDAELIMIGDGPSLEAVWKEARSRGVGSRVGFVGRVPVEALAALVRTAWVNMHFSIAEGWCLTAMEAAASGVPTVAYNVPGLNESVSPGVSGLLIPDGDVGAYADSVRRILLRSEEWSKSCRAWASRFSWESACETWAQLLARLPS